MFYKQNGIVAGILLLILFAGAIGLVSVQLDKTVNRMHYSVVEEMGEYRTELIRHLENRYFIFTGIRVVVVLFFRV